MKKIVIHGPASVLGSLAQSLSGITKDAQKGWAVLKDGREVFRGGLDQAVGYVADHSAMAPGTVRAEALSSPGLVDDGQTVWKIVHRAQDAVTPFNQSMIEELRREYSRIKTIDPGSESYKKLINLLNSMPITLLQQLSTANIPFVSNLARNRVPSARDAQQVFTSFQQWDAALKQKYGNKVKTRIVSIGLTGAFIDGKQVGVWDGLKNEGLIEG